MEITAPSDLFYPKALPGVTDTASALDMGGKVKCATMKILLNCSLTHYTMFIFNSLPASMIDHFVDVI